MNDNAFVPPLLSLTQVCHLTTMSRFLVMALSRENKFPKPVQLTGQKRIAFVRSEIMDWINGKIAERLVA